MLKKWRQNLKESNFFNMEQKDDGKTVVVKPADKGGAVVILSTGHYQSMIMQHLLDGNTY